MLLLQHLVIHQGRQRDHLGSPTAKPDHCALPLPRPNLWNPAPCHANETEWIHSFTQFHLEVNFHRIGQDTLQKHLPKETQGIVLTCFNFNFNCLRRRRMWHQETELLGVKLSAPTLSSYRVYQSLQPISHLYQHAVKGPRRQMPHRFA